MDKYCAECVKISMGNEEIIDCTKIEYIADEVHRDKEYDNIDSTEQDKADYAKEYDVKLEKFTKWFIKVDPKHCHGKYTVQLSEDVNDIEKMCMSHFFDKYNFYSTIKILNDNVGEDHDCTSYADYVSDMQTKYRFYLCKHCNERGYFKNPSICFQNKGVCDTCWFIQTNKISYLNKKMNYRNLSLLLWRYYEPEVVTKINTPQFNSIMKEFTQFHRSMSLKHYLVNYYICSGRYGLKTNHGIDIYNSYTYTDDTLAEMYNAEKRI